MQEQLNKKEPARAQTQRDIDLETLEKQLKDDLEYDQMTLVEYIDPFTGEPVKKHKK